MSVMTASERGPAGGAAPPDDHSRLRRLVDLYTSPGDRTPTWLGVAMALLAVAGLVVFGSTSELWLLACTGLLAYAVIGVVRPVEAWRVLRAPKPFPRRGERPAGAGPAEQGEDADSHPAGWLPTRRSGRR